MSTILPGSYLTFLQFGNKVFRDKLRFTLKNPNNLRLDRFRTRTDSLIFSKFVKFETNNISMFPVDENNNNVGGTVQVLTREYNLALMRPFYYSQFGYYTPEKLVFGRFTTSENYLEKESELFNITEDSLATKNSNIIYRHVYEIKNDSFQYKFEVNPNLTHLLEEEVETRSSEILPNLTKSWTETLFYNPN